ncbi:hypothetical protein [Streptomyces californicus]|uniref:hypothetical protein n=1 Tax=Streptomyces californicus TaxID=67351 RepID=UPI0038084CE2
MARCGCQGGCSCSVQGSGLISVSGNGSSGAPFVVGLTYGEDGGCAAIMGCVCDHSGDGLTCTGGQLRVQPSEDAGNLMRIGSDGGVFVPTAGASAGLVAGQAVNITGSQASGYTIGARISADQGNAVTLGTDGGLHVPGPRFAYGTLTARSVPTTTTDAWMVPVVAGQSGGFSVVPAGGVSRLQLPDGGTWFLQAQFRFNIAGFTTASGGVVYGGIDTPSRGNIIAKSYTRASSVSGMDTSVMEDFNDSATPRVGFRVQANATISSPPQAVGWWSAHRVGPSV